MTDFNLSAHLEHQCEREPPRKPNDRSVANGRNKRLVMLHQHKAELLADIASIDRAIQRIKEESNHE